MIKPHTPGGISGAHCRTSPGLRPPPHLSRRLPLGLVLPGQCRVLDVIRRAPAVFACRQPGANPKSSQVVPPSASRRPGPARTSRRPGNREARKISPVEGRKGPRGSALPAAELRQQKKKRGGSRGPKQPPIKPPEAPLHSRLLSLSAGSSRSASPPPRALPKPARAGDRQCQAHQHRSGLRAPQLPDPAHVVSLGSPWGCLRGPLPSMPPVG
ncbi:hypothetical protein NDU88_001303 [Pleurodeles waltl]|uniref:Uncharacterized protein n=1 Tax=Pleurodeles waltl TaxID=8319 RepID=A0AAV7U6I2_PLEWA|nr:hypothetical protein NDU88_001303 [Pleurodeles waltl]